MRWARRSARRAETVPSRLARLSSRALGFVSKVALSQGSIQGRGHKHEKAEAGPHPGLSRSGRCLKPPSASGPVRPGTHLTASPAALPNVSLGKTCPQSSVPLTRQKHVSPPVFPPHPEAEAPYPRPPDSRQPKPQVSPPNTPGHAGSPSDQPWNPVARVCMPTSRGECGRGGEWVPRARTPPGPLRTRALY